MATQYNSIIRLKKIDECLREKGKVYNLERLKAAIADELEKYGKEVKISDRTLYDDLKFLKDAYGPFGAPIKNSKEKGYHYTDAGFSLFNPVSSFDNTKKLQVSLATLRQVASMKGFEDLKDIVFRLESNFNFDNEKLANPIVFLEEGMNIAAQEHINPIKSYIQSKKVLSIVYQPFDKDPYSRVISPYFIKEYNNRWFLFGHQHAILDNGYEGTTNVPLDRIQSINDSMVSYQELDDVDFKNYFNDVIGVTVPDADVVRVKFRVYGSRRHYVATKKMHRSQVTVEMNDDFGVFSLSVKPNKEMYSMFLGFGGDVEVLEPREVREKMKDMIQQMNGRYRKLT